MKVRPWKVGNYLKNRRLVHFRIVRMAFRIRDNHEMRWARAPRLRHLCCTAHKIMSFRRFFAQIYDWKHLYLCIFLVRHSVALPQLQLHFCSQNAPRRWPSRCSNYSVAKRQQFSCALSTAALSMEFENVVPESWIWFSRAVSK